MFSQKRSGWKLGGVTGVLLGFVGVALGVFSLALLPAIVIGGLAGAVVGELAETQVLPRVPLSG